MLPKARLMVNAAVAHQVLGKAPEDLSPPPHVRTLDGDEQVWRRECVVGPEWQPLPLGWLEGQQVGLLVVTNEEGKFTQVQPAAEERAAALARVVELGVLAGPVPAPVTLVRPLTSVMLEPLLPVWARCRTDKAKITVTAVPG